ncbi:fibronectin type III domain-containing protein [Candidatus Bathyarchaeota archaeon]|nr:fibronectin type III domain-containing protein [Candidatus Bathyarchaeota archaeon]
MDVTTPSGVFDDGYPSGGNYWSHYTGVDVKSGPSQDSPGSDSIVDMPFIIYDDPDDIKDIKDSYPFIAPVGSVDVGTLGGTDYGVDFVTNSTAVSAFLFDPSADPPYISFEVEGEEGTAGFCRVKIPKAVLSAGDTEWVVEVNGQPVDYTVSSDAENTYLYFTYHHSIQEVKIIGKETQFTPPPPPPPPDTPPSPVTLNPPSEITETSMKLSWTESVDTDFKSYVVYQSNAGGSLGAPIYALTTKSATSYTVTDLTADTTYYFTVRVYDTGDLYADSNQVSGKTLAAPAPATVESCDSAGTTKNTFNLGEDVYVKGGGYAPSTEYVVYIVADADWMDGMAIPANVAWKYITTDSTGNLPRDAVWPNPLSAGKYDIIVDVNKNDVYDEAVDALDDFDVKTAGFFVIPEYWLGTVLGLTGCFAALGAYYMSKRGRIYHPSYQ